MSVKAGAETGSRTIRINAYAKINLTLRVLGRRLDGYHDLRTVFQTIGLHDSLTLTAVPTGWSMECDDPRCPIDESNLVWRAAEHLVRAARPRGSRPGVRIRLRKRIPIQAGLGGGSSDAAAALRALAVLWRLPVAGDRLRVIARNVGADVPFFLEGGTSLGVDRGDVLFPLIDGPRCWVVLAVPDIGVSTRDAYNWWDVLQSATPRRASARCSERTAFGLHLPDWGNDLEAAVLAHHPAIGRICRRLCRLGASHAAMSGSGSSVFGLFSDERRARAAAAAVSSRAVKALVTQSVGRRRFAGLSQPRIHFLFAPRGMSHS